MRLILGSGGFRTPERVQLWTETVQSFLGPGRCLLFVPYALADHDAYLKLVLERGLHAGYELHGIHQYPDPRQAVEQAEVIFIGGGNSFRLLDALYRLDLLGVIRDRVRQGVPYLGISAGSNVACPTIKTTNDMPIVQPPSFAALGLVPFQINPHFVDGPMFIRVGDGYQEHFGETRAERLREFHEMNTVPVIGLWEGGIIHVEEGQVTLLGAPARVFRKDNEPVNRQPGALLNDL